MEENQEFIDRSEYVKKYFWLIRPCEDYEREARECKNLKSRFHQYFIHGTFSDCSSWVRDAQNCENCVSSKNDIVCAEIIKNEAQRRLKRLEAHKNNDVWEERTRPPENWNAPLPEWWLRENKKSYFKECNIEFQAHIKSNEPKKTYNCVIL